MIKRTGFFDVDDTLLVFLPSLIRWHNQAYGTQISEDSADTYDFSRILNLSPQEAEARTMAFLNSSSLEQIPPAPYAFKCLSHIAQHYSLGILTSRLPEFKELTKQVIPAHFPGIFTEFHFSANHFIKSSGKTKAQICREQNAAFLVEDHHHYASECALQGTPVFLFQKKYNSSFNGHQGIYRVRDFSHLEELFVSGEAQDFIKSCFRRTFK